jgi:hypothetical protein
MGYQLGEEPRLIYLLTFIGNTTMSNETPVITVDGLLQEACIASGTMTTKTKEAAKLAAAELDAKISSLAERVKAVVAAHAKGYADNHNVKAIFSDTLWLLAVPNAKVESKIANEATPKIFTAAQSIDLPKHQLRDAAKQVRESVGAARVSGGGTKAKAVPAPAPLTNDTFYSVLESKLRDAGELAKVVQALENAGYSVIKKGKKVAPVVAAPKEVSVQSLLKDKILAAASV